MYLINKTLMFSFLVVWSFASAASNNDVYTCGDFKIVGNERKGFEYVNLFNPPMSRSRYSSSTKIVSYEKTDSGLVLTLSYDVYDGSSEYSVPKTLLIQSGVENGSFLVTHYISNQNNKMLLELYGRDRSVQLMTCKRSIED